MEAAAMVQETAAAGRRLLQDHLEDHLFRNPDSSYAAWIAALHPDNVQVDDRLLMEDNEWFAIWRSSHEKPYLDADQPRKCIGRAKITTRSRSLTGALIELCLMVFNLITACILESSRHICLSLAHCFHAIARRIPRASR